MKKISNQKESQLELLLSREQEVAAERESLMRRHEAYIERLEELMTEFSEEAMRGFSLGLKEVLAVNDKLLKQ